MVSRATKIGALDGATSGRQTLGEIERAIEDLRQRERNVQGELEAITKRRSGLIEERLQAYRDLAEVRARHAISDGVIDEADRLSHRVRSLLTVRQATIDDLKARLARADATQADLVAARDTLSERIEKLEARLDELALEARQKLAVNPDYRRDLQALEEAATTHAKAGAKAARAEQDRIDKGRAYETDPLFMYLWRRGFGTRDYASTGLVRWLDGKVAHLVGYHGARANYAVLNEIPVRLAEHVERLAADLTMKQAAVDGRETTMMREIARADVPADLRRARADEAENQRRFEAASAEVSDASAQLNSYAEGQDAAFKKAIDLSAAFLGREETSRLMQLARETQSPTDDEIAARIARFDADIARSSAEIDARTQDLEKLFEKRDELVRIAADFRRAHYDDGASVFRGNNVGAILLEELIRGAITGADYWARTRHRQTWRNRPADPYRRSENFPPFDDLFGGQGNSGRGGRDRGGRGRGGGGRGGGDWGGGDWGDFDLDDLFDVDDWGDRDFRSGGGF